MRIDVKKFLFMGAYKDKAQFYEEAQKLGAIEFIHPTGKRFSSFSSEVSRLIQALKSYPPYIKVDQDMRKSLVEADLIVEKILDTKKNHDNALEMRRVLRGEIERVKPFGNFSLKEIKKIEEETNVRFRFFLAKSSKNMQDMVPTLILISQKDGIDYFLSLENVPITSHDLVELEVTDSLHGLQQKLKNTEATIATTHEELKSLKRFETLLNKALIHKINELNLAAAHECSEFELENQLFFVEAWVPVNKIDAIQILSKNRAVFFEEVKIEEQEKTPTYLENAGISRVGEDVIRIFDIPSNRDKDPSLWVLFAFSLFFSMIVFDAGYGLIFLAVAMYLRMRMRKKSPSQTRAIALMTILAISCTIWGGMTHSFFGMQLDPNNFFRKHSFMTWLIEKKAAYHMAEKDSVYQEIVAKYPEEKEAANPEQFVQLHVPTATAHYPIASKFTDNLLMELALFLGAIHIITGLIRYLPKNPMGIGWIAFIIGAYLYLPYYLHATSLLYFVFGLNPETSAQFGLHLLFLGIGLAILISVIQHGFSGIFEGMHVIQVFGDVLSYLRIYALGTAAYIVAETVNHMASKVPLLVAIFLLVFGHAINIILSVMGGTIHGLRLNFLEWYRYSFYGGGKNFEPLQLKNLR